VKVLNVDFTARASLNPDEAMRSTSVAVRVYQLNDRKRFDEASYDDLLKNDKTCRAEENAAGEQAIEARTGQPGTGRVGCRGKIARRLTLGT
jgi:type VI secretion system protein VasD